MKRKYDVFTAKRGKETKEIKCDSVRSVEDLENEVSKLFNITACKLIANGRVINSINNKNKILSSMDWKSRNIQVLGGAAIVGEQKIVDEMELREDEQNYAEIIKEQDRQFERDLSSTLLKRYNPLMVYKDDERQEFADMAAFLGNIHILDHMTSRGSRPNLNFSQVILCG